MLEDHSEDWGYLTESNHDDDHDSQLMMFATIKEIVHIDEIRMIMIVMAVLFAMITIMEVAIIFVIVIVVLTVITQKSSNGILKW